jgi:Big-like domain-containing protein
MHQKHNPRNFILAILGTCACLIVAQPSAVRASRTKTSSQVSITSPATGATVSGSVPIVATASTTVVWVDFYVDSNYVASSPPYTEAWNSDSTANGEHIVSVKGFSSSGTLLATAAVNVTVKNLSASPTPTPTPAPTPSPAPTPAPTVSYYFAPSGSDSSGCSSSAPCQSLAKAQSMLGSAKPGTQLLFARGGVWSGGITLPAHVNGASGNPIVIGNYGSGALPVIDGGGSASACFNARNTGTSTSPLWSYLIINGFECRNTTEYGVLFYQNAGGSFGMPGIIVENMDIHNTGPLTDDGNYRNQLMFLDENKKPDGVQFLNNTIASCGGHNCVEVQMDTGSPIISGNYCNGPWNHNCIDLKAVTGALVKKNIVDGTGAAGGSAFYVENTEIPAADVTFQENVAYNAPNGFECEWGGTGTGLSTTCHVLNNTAYLGTQSAIVTGGDPTCGDVILDVRNNILDTSDTYYDGHSCTTPTWDYNDDGASQGKVSGPAGPHDMNGANPLYMSASSANFQLTSTSPCMGAGEVGLTTGNSNMGAY